MKITLECTRSNEYGTTWIETLAADTGCNDDTINELYSKFDGLLIASGFDPETVKSFYEEKAELIYDDTIREMRNELDKADETIYNLKEELAKIQGNPESEV